ncbi:tyrosinase family oxidase copper chaperone [Streptomyces sp. H10-C2]|uniref:tyrosinase family oxidase copper chaperone n=1 Tax=unclassified Streptomyces TaxID=2593676 RepID=UPI0024BAC8B1|nr:MULTISPECIES: tyrosinase family oxidase copper chaperone [unclassified Streptomyces]MDJ0340336.1 tyrosinase family oxidase copper chaperone [Streptomyces sp. PH10-H1]MDJ0368216.1 tyrosinase family oxidase copper chaperone [Streptomyces sp. H10-C2]
MSEAKESSGGKAPSSVTRRRMLKAAITAAVTVTGTTAALYPILTAKRTEATGTQGTAGGTGDDRPPSDPSAGAFDEIYRGRRIRGLPTGTDATADGATAKPGVDILIDGRPLHVMRRADGSYVSVANHYQSFATPLATARGAVDVIGGAQLSLATSYHH